MTLAELNLGHHDQTRDSATVTWTICLLYSHRVDNKVESHSLAYLHNRSILRPSFLSVSIRATSSFVTHVLCHAV